MLAFPIFFRYGFIGPLPNHCKVGTMLKYFWSKIFLIYLQYFFFVGLVNLLEHCKSFVKGFTGKKKALSWDTRAERFENSLAEHRENLVEALIIAENSVSAFCSFCNVNTVCQYCFHCVWRLWIEIQSCAMIVMMQYILYLPCMIDMVLLMENLST